MGAAELVIRELDFEGSFDVDTGTLRLAGNADSSVAKQLDALARRIHAMTGARDLAIDLRSVEFMAASCFNVFVVWVGLIIERPVHERYQLRFALNDAVPWQRRSLATLTCFATDVVKVGA